jgi:group I intron endonuclease
MIGDIMIKITNFLNWTKVAGIYGIKNTTNGKWYVGSASCNGKRSISVRIRDHIRLLCRNKHNNQHLQAAWNKYNSQAFEYFVLEVTENVRDVLWELELYWMIALEAVSKGYNISTNPRYAAVPWTEKRKQQLSQASSERWASPEYKEKMSAISKERMSLSEYKVIAGDTLRKLWSDPETREKFIAQHRGKEMSKETRQKLHDAHQGKPKLKLRGRPLSEETKKKLGDSKRGKPNYKRRGKGLWSEEDKKRIGEINKGNKYNVGRVLSDSTKNKISKSHLGKTWSEDAHVAKRMKPPTHGLPKGVSFNTREQKYKGQINKKFLGWFNDQVIAAENYDYYALKFYGRDNCYLNFPEKDYTNFMPKKMLNEPERRTNFPPEPQLPDPILPDFPDVPVRPMQKPEPSPDTPPDWLIPTSQRCQSKEGRYETLEEAMKMDKIIEESLQRMKCNYLIFSPKKRKEIIQELV